MAVSYPLLSVVVPIYFEEDTIPEFYSRMKSVLVGLESDLRHELIFVNDGSTDRSPLLLKEISRSDKNVRIINFSRNFGHQVAITAGIEHASGDAVVVIDGDLQDPPEVIAGMVEKWREGYKVVYGVRSVRKGETAFKLLTARLFYRLISRMSDVKLPLDSGDFRLMDRVVVEALNSIREENRYIRGLISWIGFSQYALPYERDSRYAGETKFNLKKMLKFALDGITSFSDRPLRISSKLGTITTVVAFLAMLYIIVSKFVNPESVIQGWTSLLVVVLFLGGVQLISIGVLGEYIGRIYRETKHRPLYIVEEKVGFVSPAQTVPRDDAAASEAWRERPGTDVTAA
ncbi:glycosyltransferase family 2 protein [Geobacter sp. DSM 9736]|uniref:glycosyltransferase family 2 protein n=1 Tax=Geobacter sp. DSM 9736 TaxID=1277350 RepID=UPI000B50F557|nr:glycosyltransferase family 2 protein [Geobacter sp. DSM 9736]SNB48121.1 dolichol-phosphate mannosyltransferase [Geobacter sp. DSM 9736]